MSTAVTRSAESQRELRPHSLFYGIALFVLVAAVLVISAPLTVAITAVFLFAGPHNWIEARLLLERMPPRWGVLRGYFLTAGLGALSLTLSHWMLVAVSTVSNQNPIFWRIAHSTWLTLFVSWVVMLVYLRARQNPRRDWALALPIGLSLAALAWIRPAEFGLLLVYGHPLVSVWFLEREITLRHPKWQADLRRILMVMGCGLIVVIAALATSGLASSTDALTARIRDHAGANLLTWVPDRCLIATHTYLELLHYGVWLLALPAVSLSSFPWSLNSIPLARPRAGWRNVIVAVLSLGALGVVLLWMGFLWDYSRMRDIYFELAMFHVLMEIPFLIRRL